MFEFIIGFIIGSLTSLFCYSLIAISNFNEKELK